MFENKKALILGVANKRSIAWAIAKRLADGGAECAFTFQGERIEKNVRELAEGVAVDEQPNGGPVAVACRITERLDH